ncbi:collagenase-like [Hyposmocoma kahamanoa]|uniref:collagenase-like n=1 Tax=Hyposmocoma kahamanoa TaxID=1477025 RepID=UPI000E6D7D74|nr:collagenase-like [Hyposmocoma kahamanoa]
MTEEDQKSFYVDEIRKLHFEMISRPHVHKNISSLLDNVRYYHELIGIPLAEEIRLAEKKLKGKSKNYLTRVSGGHDAKLGFFPFIAGLRITLINGKASVCGASLVTLTRLVTAAHCWKDSSYKAISMLVVLGSLSIFIKEKSGQSVSTSDVVVHPNFDAQKILNDVAVIRLKNKVKITKTVQVVRLPTRNMLEKTFEEYRAYIAGFGRMSSNSIVDSHVRLGYKKIKVIGNEKCKDYYGDVLKPTYICAGAPDGAACRGDSGGPLAYKTKSQYYLIGVSSFGPLDCGESSAPSVFSRITSYIDWIQKQL